MTINSPQSFEVPEPILNSPYEEPREHWYILEGEPPRRQTGWRPAIVFPPRDQKREWDISDGILRRSKDYPNGYELAVVNLVRRRLADWRQTRYAGASRTTLDLIEYWRRDGRQHRLFFAQLEAAETIIFLIEARADLRQGINLPLDMPGEQQIAEGARAFTRYACKMATGSGKTTVMGMLAAWSILNKVQDRGDARFSDLVLIVCPNVTIRQRLAELDPNLDEASLYRKRDLVPPHLMKRLREGRVIITNWHNFEPKTSSLGGVSARVSKTGKAERKRETINIGAKTTTARGSRYLTQQDYQTHVAAGLIKVLKEERDDAGNLKKVQVETVRYIQTDTSLVNGILGSDGKQNILVMNDEAHHAYRIRKPEPDEDEEEEFGEDEEAEEFFKEATVWVDGLDKIHRLRGINVCLDLSATPYYLGRVGQDTNKPFPWVVSDFGLTDAIESGLVKIPQLAVRDSSGAEIPGYFNIWHWILPKLTPRERGGSKASPKPEAILKYAHVPIAMLGGLWEELRMKWEREREDNRPPVFIIVCKNTRIARAIYDWLAENKHPSEVAPSKIEGFLNRDGKINTIRVDTKVVHETDTGEAKSDETRWMRFTLDTVGRTAWPADWQGRPIYPEGFEELAGKLKRPLHPPGRDIRCIVSVGMLTEGWDCTTVTHIIGLRPFMSQLLCEQVVGRGLRRSNYNDLTEDGRFTEEVAKVLGVPFEVIPFKASPGGAPPPPEKRHHVHAIPSRARFEITFPRVEGYTQAIRNRITVDWDKIPRLRLEPDKIPPEVEMKALSVNNKGRMTLHGPGRLDEIGLQTFRAQHRMQELVFDLAAALTRDYLGQSSCEVPAHTLFPQVAAIVKRYVNEKVRALKPADVKDLFLSPYYGWVIEILLNAIRPDTADGEAPEVPRYESSRGPGSTADVDFWTSRDVREVIKSHLNYVVADTMKWEQSAAYYIDKHPLTEAFAKNAGLGFSIPYFHNGEPHEYVPDFIIRLATDPPTHLILETKGWDPLEEVKTAAAARWVAAVNADGQYGRWAYAVARRPEDVTARIEEALAASTPDTAAID